MTPKLLHVFATFAPGGAQVRAVQLIEAMGAAFRHSIVAMDGRVEAAELLSGRAEVKVLQPPARAGSLRTVRALLRILGKTSPDLLLTYNWGAFDAVVAARLTGRPVVHHEDGFGPDETKRFKLRRVLTRRALLRGAAGVVVPSRQLESIALERWKLPRGRVHFVPNGLRVTDFRQADGHPELRRELGIPSTAFVVGFVGHLRREKNPVRLVRALALASTELHLLVVGEGSERAAVERAGRDLEVSERLHLVGHCEITEPYYRTMDAFALSSDTEQMPLALLEAMAAGLPVVSTDVGDVSTMLPPEGRRHVVSVRSVGTDEALAAALDSLARDRERSRRIGSDNRAHVARCYGFEQMLESYHRRYLSALAGGVDPPTGETG